jgi:hypothetical protein
MNFKVQVPRRSKAKFPLSVDLIAKEFDNAYLCYVLFGFGLFNIRHKSVSCSSVVSLAGFVVGPSSRLPMPRAAVDYDR